MSMGGGLQNACLLPSKVGILCEQFIYVVMQKVTYIGKYRSCSIVADGGGGSQARSFKTMFLAQGGGKTISNH